jgi:AraC-like DNA-binding protein
MYLSHAPTGLLAPFVASIFYGRTDGAEAAGAGATGAGTTGLEWSLPSGESMLVVNLAADEVRWSDPGPGGRPETGGREIRVGGAALCGVRDRPVLIDTVDQRWVMGIAFRPGGTWPFFGPPTVATAGNLVDLADREMWGRDGSVLRDRLLSLPTPEAKMRVLEEMLVARASRPLEWEREIRYAVHGLHAGMPVGEVADQIGAAPGRFGRRFADRVGLLPKRFARVRRFQRVLSVASCSVDSLDWARLAADHGYVDQSHLIRDFREFAGITPTGYRPRSPGERNHLPVG